MRHLASSWEHLATQDPLWAILTVDGKSQGRWSIDDFLATGVSDVDRVWERLSEFQLRPGTRRAMDYGCGVGRLTRALAPRFDQVDGIDVSAAMLRKAREIAPLPANVRLIHNTRPDLRVLGVQQYTFILSLISLQHVPEKIALRYIAGMCERLAPGGIAYLQMFTFLDATVAPAAAKLARDESALNRTYRALRAPFVRKPPRMDSHYCRLSLCLGLIERNRLRLVAVLPDSSGPAPFISHVLIFQRAGNERPGTRCRSDRL